MDKSFTTADVSSLKC